MDKVVYSVLFLFAVCVFVRVGYGLIKWDIEDSKQESFLRTGKRDK